MRKFILLALVMSNFLVASESEVNGYVWNNFTQEQRIKYVTKLINNWDNRDGKIDKSIPIEKYISNIGFMYYVDSPDDNDRSVRSLLPFASSMPKEGESMYEWMIKFKLSSYKSFSTTD